MNASAYFLHTVGNHHAGLKMKAILFIAVALILQSEYVQAHPISGSGESNTISLGSFEITIPAGWRHKTSDSNQGVFTSIYHPDGIGTLKLKSLTVPQAVTQEMLRNLTNVESSIALAWQNWGDYLGYQHSYSERGSYYRTWWLTNERTIIFITYECDPELKDIETEEIAEIVRSITVNNA